MCNQFIPLCFSFDELVDHQALPLGQPIYWAQDPAVQDFSRLAFSSECCNTMCTAFLRTDAWGQGEGSVGAHASEIS